MKILIRAQGCRLFLPIPTRLITGSLLRRAATKWAAPQAQITDRQILLLQQEIRRIRRDFGHLVLVDVTTAQGEHVKITL